MSIHLRFCEGTLDSVELPDVSANAPRALLVRHGNDSFVSVMVDVAGDGGLVSAYLSIKSFYELLDAMKALDPQIAAETPDQWLRHSPRSKAPDVAEVKP